MPQVEGLTQQLESSDAELRSRVAERTEQLRKQVGEAEGREDQLRQQLRAAVAASEAVKAKQVRQAGKDGRGP